MSETIDVDHLRRWIGREHVASEAVMPDLVRRFRSTLDLPADEPIDEPAPRLIHFCLAQPAAPTMELGADGHPARGGFLPPVALPRRLWAGGAMTFHAELRVGDDVRRTSRITGVDLKHGRTGPLCFVTVKHRIEVGGVLAVDERQDIVYRGSDPAAPGAAPPPAEAGAHQCRVSVTPPLLFRYSALTFNSHRIHYDRPYATDVEAYPGLVVHGPLQATWLVGFAAQIRGQPPSSFSFRSLSPLFDLDTMSLHATEADGGLKLWTARAGGPVAMAAEATWA